MNPRIVRIAVFGAIAIGVAMYVKMSRRGELGDQAKANANQILTQAEGYETHRKFFELYSDLAHQSALSEAYTIGGRRARDTFDPNVYMGVFFGKLMNRARDEGKPDIVKMLQGICDEESITPVT
jgi:hypothetical protein